MTLRLVITQEAKNDINQAANWHESQQKGLGKKYLLSISDCVKFLLTNPFAFARIFFEIRKINTKKFPYSLYYQLNESLQEIVIFAVIHNNRGNDSWQKRIEND